MDVHKFKPLRALMLVRRDDPVGEKGGIVIPENVKTYGWRATVEKVGKDANGYKQGDVILYQKEYTVLPFAERVYAITDAKHILARIVVEEVIERIMPQNEFVLIYPVVGTDVDDGIFLTDKTKTNEPIGKGKVVRVGDKCQDVLMGDTVWFPVKAGITCVEADTVHKLVNARDVLCKRN